MISDLIVGRFCAPNMKRKSTRPITVAEGKVAEGALNPLTSQMQFITLGKNQWSVCVTHAAL